VDPLRAEEPSVGVDALDAEHRHVRRRLRQLAAGAAEGRADVVRGALLRLHAELSARLEAEERWIAQVGYPGEREHARAHRLLLRRLEAARAAEPRALLAAAGELCDAVEAHLRYEDLKLGRFWTARQNLRRLAEGTVALTPIPVGTPLPARATPPPGAAARRDPAAEPRAALAPARVAGAATPPPGSPRGR
jgi:hemerythrin